MTAVPGPAARAAAALDPAALLAWVRTRRWFSAKAGAPRGARVLDVVPLPWENGAFAIARIAIETEQGVLHYQLPVALRRSPPDGIAPIATTADGVIFDAVEDAAFRTHLAGVFGRGCTITYDGGRWIAEPAGAKGLVLPPDAAVHLGSAEQSNTSLRVGEAAILKLFRRLEAGPHPDVEVTAFLTTGHGFPYTPVLLGTMRWETAEGTTVGGMLQELVPEATDAWAHTLAVARPYFAASAPPHDAFAKDAAQLGRVTRTMHETLASDARDPAFAPEPATQDAVAAWGAAAKRQIDGAIALLARQADGLGAEARAVADRQADYYRLVDDIVRAVGDDAGVRIRHHGDYHLGQVLRAASGEFMVIDFEGEPARSLDERRQKQCALRDVAGMLRSFAYAAATLANEQQHGDAADRARAWEANARSEFLRAYFAGARARFLPSGDAQRERLLALFEIEKVFYELSYELNNRPDWVAIPLRGIAALAAR